MKQTFKDTFNSIVPERIPNFFLQSSRTREARTNGSRIMENEFDLSEVEGFEDIPGGLDQ